MDLGTWILKVCNMLVCCSMYRGFGPLCLCTFGVQVKVQSTQIQSVPRVSRIVIVIMGLGRISFRYLDP